MAVPVIKTLTVQLINSLNNPNTDDVLTLSPNPATDKLLINYNETINPTTTVSIFNSQGKKIASQKLSDIQTDLNVSNFPSGIYFIEIYNESKTISRKFIKK